MSSKRSQNSSETEQATGNEDSAPENPTLEGVSSQRAADETVAPEEDSVELQLEQAQQKVKEYWDQNMRLRAEIENNRKRAVRDVENAHKYAMKGFVESLLPVVDSMELGQIASEAENATLESIREGTRLTCNMFMQVLEKHGLTQIDPVGEKFNPEQHQAMSMVEDENVESNTVIAVMQKGFLLNDRLVRPAMVVVSK